MGRWCIICTLHAEIHARMGSGSPFVRNWQETCLWTRWQAFKAQDQNMWHHICRWLTSIIILCIWSTSRSIQRHDCPSNRMGARQGSETECSVGSSSVQLGTRTVASTGSFIINWILCKQSPFWRNFANCTVTWCYSVGMLANDVARSGIFEGLVR